MHSWVYEIKMEVSLKLKVVMEKFQSSESLRIEKFCLTINLVITELACLVLL